MNNISIADIEKVLDEKVRPDLLLDGGNLKIVDFSEGVLRVRMTGHCSGCPSAELTMENLVKAELKEAFPNIQVALVTGVSDDLIAEARRIMREHAQ